MYKRQPFIGAGTVAASALMIALPFADLAGRLGVFIVLLGLLLIAMGTYRSPAVALMPDLTPKPLRSRANAIINLMGAIGGIYALLMINLLVTGEPAENPSYLPLFVSVAALMLLSVALLVITAVSYTHLGEWMCFTAEPEERFLAWKRKLRLAN